MATIGVFQHWGLGDLVMTVPVLSELRRLNPSACIILMVRGKAQASLMEDSPLIDEVLQVPPNTDLAGLMRFFAALRSRHFDAVYVATRITPLVPLLLRFISGVRTIIGDADRFGFLYTHRNSLDPTVHRVDRMLKTLSIWTGCSVEKPAFDLPVAEAARLSAKARLAASGLADARYFAFHPGSSRGPGIEKRVPIPLVRGVIEALRMRDPEMRFVVMLGPDDMDLVPQFEAFPADVVLISGSSLDETKAILSRAIGFLGSDSALGHIAASWGVPTITAVGPTNPNETRPWGALSHVIASREELACRPCWFTPLKGHCPHDRRCMTGITVEQIMDDVSLLPPVAGVPVHSTVMVSTSEKL
ncbi:MAG: glycosyltransferase family 9 protein [Nevskia sp.]|nr:glycosyltransferase family 9 protein [Nevskia sp.]